MLWLQHGHMLKESGLFGKARTSYQKALMLEPENPEAFLQLAILAKLEGDFNGALEHYQKADMLGHPLRDFIAGEIAFIRKTSGISLVAPQSERAGTRILLSSVAESPAESDTRGLKGFLGGTHYSYAYAMMGFRDALEQAGIQCELIRHPEYIADIRNGSSAQVHIHLGFYPPDGARYLKGARNIMCVAWEFERLKTYEETLSYHAFADATAVLSRSQEVWLTSEYGAEACRRSGLTAVRHVPTPVATATNHGRAGVKSLPELQRIALKLDRISWVPLAIWPAMQSTLSQQAFGRSRALLNLLLDSGDGTIPNFFLSVFNVHDFRKQIKPLLHAFSFYCQGNKNAYLLLKVNCIDGNNEDINEILFAAQVKDDGEITTPLICDNVLITTEALSRDEMNFLYSMASFYVCTSYAEGQNLPLLEAMGHGIVPVSVDHTAMRDYITTQNAIVIPALRAAFTTRLVHRYGMFGLKTYHVTGRDVYAALVTAGQLSEQEYYGFSEESVRTVKQKFGITPLREALDSAIARSLNEQFENATGVA